MGTVADPLAAAGFVTHVKHATGTTLASTALTAPHRENGPAPLLSQRGVTAVTRLPLTNSAVYSFDSVLVGSHGNFSALELRSPFVLPAKQQGLPSSAYLLTLQPFFLQDRFLSLFPLMWIDSSMNSVIILTKKKLHNLCGPRPSQWFSPGFQLEYSL